MPNISDIYAELTTDWSTSLTSSTSDLNTSSLAVGGKYLVIINAQVGEYYGHHSNIRSSYGGVELNGSLYSIPSRSSIHENRYSYFTMIEPTVSGLSVSLDAKSISPSPSVNIKTATIICLDLSNLAEGGDYIFSENLSEIENSENYANVNYIDIPATKPSSGDWLVLAGSSYKINTGNVDLHQRINYKGIEMFPESIQSTDDVGERKTGYMQRVVNVPYVGYPTHLGGTALDGAYKRVALQGRDTAGRPTNNVCKDSKMFALRLNSIQHSRFTQSSSSYTLESSSFETVSSIGDYNPPQDDSLTLSSGVFTTGKSVILAYGSFSPLGSSSSHLRCWLNLDWEDAGPVSDLISGLSDDSIFVSLGEGEKNPIGFGSIKESSLTSGVKEINMNIKTYSDNSKLYYGSLCVLNLGEPVTVNPSGPRASLEMNSIIRLH